MEKADAVKAQEAASAGAPPAYDSSDIRYIWISASQHCVYLTRSDGIVDRSSGSGKVTSQLIPEEGFAYVQCSAGHDNSYALRNDGSVFVIRNGKIKDKTIGIKPASGVKYTEVAAGPHASYFVRDDGKVDRTKRAGDISSVMEPEGYPNVKYTTVRSGWHASYFVRSDGKIDRVKSGAVEMTIECEAGGRNYVSVGELLTWTHSNGQSTYTDGSYAAYFLRDDGYVDRTHKNGKIDFSYQNKYTYVCSGEQSSYLVREDGAVERLRGEGKVGQTIPGGPGWKYISAAAGESAVYLLRSDGNVDRSKSKGKIEKTMTPPTREEAVSNNSGCIIS